MGIPIIPLMMWGAWAKYSFFHSAENLRVIKRAEQEDPEAQAENMHNTAIFMHGVMIRNVAALLLVLSWLGWDILGLYWQNQYRYNELKDTVYQQSLIGTIVLLVLLPVLVCQTCQSKVAAADDQASSSDSN